MVRSRVLAVLLVASLAAGVKPAAGQQSGPVVVVETSAGAFAFETFPDEAPKTVAHILELVRQGFYDGQRFHRAIPGFVVQWGDPQTRNLEKSRGLGERRRRVQWQADWPLRNEQEAAERQRCGGRGPHGRCVESRQPDLRDAGEPSGSRTADTPCSDGSSQAPTFPIVSRRTTSSRGCTCVSRRSDDRRILREKFLSILALERLAELFLIIAAFATDFAEKWLFV